MILKLFCNYVTPMMPDGSQEVDSKMDNMGESLSYVGQDKVTGQRNRE